MAAGGIAASTALDDPVLKMIALSIAGFGIFGCLPVIWTLHFFRGRPQRAALPR
ncbi:MAG: Nitrate/nitrite transporter [uncultured Caballeronia sp.]|nr:MAG: Nitrate/nitrite transporter [uncultured Caballeronia sp.]